jgi:hypothetical protein
MIPAGVGGVNGGNIGFVGDYWTAFGRSGRMFYYCTQTEHIEAFRIACIERVRCANAFRMGSSNSSFTTKSYACTSVAFLEGIISWSVGSE